MIDWLISSLIDCLIGWLIDWSVDWLIGWLMDLLIDWLVDWLIDWLVDWLIDWLVDWWICWLIDWLIDWLVDWLVDWLIWIWCISCLGEINVLNVWKLFVGGISYLKVASAMALWIVTNRRAKSLVDSTRFTRWLVRHAKSMRACEKNHPVFSFKWQNLSFFEFFNSLRPCPCEWCRMVCREWIFLWAWNGPVGRRHIPRFAADFCTKRVRKKTEKWKNQDSHLK